MARTYRRRQGRDRRACLLRDPQTWTHGNNGHPRRDPDSPEGRRILARYYADAHENIGSPAPRHFRKMFDRQIKARNHIVLQRWLRYRDFEPVFQDWHKHAANWHWW